MEDVSGTNVSKMRGNGLLCWLCFGLLQYLHIIIVSSDCSITWLIHTGDIKRDESNPNHVPFIMLNRSPYSSQTSCASQSFQLNIPSIRTKAPRPTHHLSKAHVPPYEEGKSKFWVAVKGNE